MTLFMESTVQAVNMQLRWKWNVCMHDVSFFFIHTLGMVAYKCAWAFNIGRKIDIPLF